ncbi:MAG: hypothetical protein J4G12_00950 [Gemmatimonadetes bacterium]|nr:hypothetical protein [Gemmatimonadota bacterium]
MPQFPLSALSPRSRLWVFPSDTGLGEDAASALLGEVDAFLPEWAAHGRALRSGRELYENRFLVVAVDEDRSAASGCSIDALTRKMRELGRLVGSSLVDHSKVWYRDDAGIVRCVSRSRFRMLAESGAIGPETPVFDTTFSNLGDMRSRGLERPAGKSWHARLTRGAWERGRSGT